MTPPTVPVQPVDLVSLEAVRSLLATCSTKAFVDLRDAAIIRLLVDTGMRRLGVEPAQVANDSGR